MSESVPGVPPVALSPCHPVTLPPCHFKGFLVRVVLPYHLRTLARVEGEVTLAVDGAVTQRSVLDALEDRYPVLCGTIRDQATHKRRPFLRFFACALDLSNEAPDEPLPAAVTAGREPFLVVGAVAGG